MSESDQELRRSSPSATPNNQDVFIWALYRLGGAEHDVDVESIYLLSFDLAPARLGWRTRPDLPDYKKTSKALQTVEAQSHIGLVHKTSQYLRRLTYEGALWVERNRAILDATYEGQAPVPATPSNIHERRRRAVRASHAFALWQAGQSIPLVPLADCFECNPASPYQVWSARIIEIRRAAEVLKDTELENFAAHSSGLIAALVKD